jgi:pyridoxal biosynthesis lyase PdxS
MSVGEREATKGSTDEGTAEILKGGVTMDVVNIEQARIAGDAGPISVMPIERAPADIRAGWRVPHVRSGHAGPDHRRRFHPGHGEGQGSGIFRSGNPAQRAATVVKATTFFDDPDVIAMASRGLGEAIGRHQLGRDRAAASPHRTRLVGRGSIYEGGSSFY